MPPAAIATARGPHQGVAPGAAARFAELTRDLSDRAFRTLGALALEQGLPRSVLRAMPDQPVPELDAFLAGAVSTGLLEEERPAPAVPFAAAASQDRWFSLPAAFEQLVLRELHARHQLGDLALALQDGDLARFERAVAVRRLPRRAPPRSSTEWLRAAVCEPFDADWLLRTFGPRALAVAARVLHESLDG